MSRIPSRSMRARAVRIGEAGQLDVPLAPVAAVGEIVVEVAGMGHELGHAARQLAQVREHALGRPVRVRPRLAHEVIRRLERELARRRPHLRVLRPHRHLDGAREVQHQLQDRLLPADVVVRVQVRGEPSHDLPELVDLHPELDARLVRSGALGGLPGIAGERPFPVQERGHPLRGRHRRAQREVHVQPHAHPRGLEGVDQRGVHRAVHEQGRARHDPAPVRVQDAAAHARGEAIVVGVDDEIAGRLHRDGSSVRVPCAVPARSPGSRSARPWRATRGAAGWPPRRGRGCARCARSRCGGRPASPGPGSWARTRRRGAGRAPP